MLDTSQQIELPEIGLTSAAPVLAPTVSNAPGNVERAMAVLTFFVFYHQTPNAWFIYYSDLTRDYSNLLAPVSILLLVGLLSLRVIGNFDMLIQIFKLEPSIYLFATLTAGSFLWSADMNETVRRGVIFLVVTLFASYLVIRFCLDEILEILSWMFSISAVLNLMFIAAFPGYGIDQLGRWSGVFPQKNALGYIAALALPTLLITARARPKYRLVFYATVVLQCGLLFMSESKTMLVVGLGSTSLIPIFHWFRARRTLRGAVILSISTSALATLAFATANIALLAKWLDKDISLTGRVPLWEALVPIATDQWALGYGYGAVFRGYFSPVHEMLITVSWDPSHAHNAALQIMLEVGLVGLGLFLFAYLRGISNGIKALASTPGPVALWPLTILALVTLVSITESGVHGEPVGWTMFVVAVLSVSAASKGRSSAS